VFTEQRYTLEKNVARLDAKRLKPQEPVSAANCPPLAIVKAALYYDWFVHFRLLLNATIGANNFGQVMRTPKKYL